MNVDLEVNSQTVGLIAVEDKCTDSDVGPAKATFTFSEAFLPVARDPLRGVPMACLRVLKNQRPAYSLVQCSLSLQELPEAIFSAPFHH